MFKKREKIYKFDRMGLAQVMYDIRKERQAKVDNVLSVLFILMFFSFGLLSKEFLLLYVTGKGTSFITKIFFWEGGFISAFLF